MTDHDAFTRVICLRTAKGQDTTAERLIFADWLEEHAVNKAEPCPNYSKELIHPKSCRLCHGTGSVSNGYAERAEFIKTQIQLAALDAMEGESLVGSQITLRCCERELLEEHALLWFEKSEFQEDWKAIANVTNKDGSKNHGGWFNGDAFVLADFRRGFVARVRCSFREWCGEVCRYCDDDEPEHLPCKWCSGIGRINALGPRIVACCPIEEFEATDTAAPVNLPWSACFTREDNNRRALEWARDEWQKVMVQ